MTIQMTRQRAAGWDGLDLLEADFDNNLAEAAEHGCWVDAAPFRAHVRRLMSETGVAWRTIGVLADVPSPALDHLLRGRNGRPMRRIHPLMAQRLFHLTEDALSDAAVRPVHGGSTRRLLGLLGTRGWSVDEIARRARLPEAELVAVADGRQIRCSQLLAATVKAAAQALWNRPPMGRTAAVRPAPVRSAGRRAPALAAA
jgi:predicted transcriptional regulator